MAMNEDSNELWLAFEADAERNLADAEEALSSLGSSDTEETAELLNQLYRVLHTFKGNARMMGLPNLAQVSHYAEDIVTFAQRGLEPVDGDSFALVLETIDFIAGIIPTLIDEQSDIPDDQCKQQVNRLFDAVQAIRFRTGGGPVSASAERDLSSEPVVLFDELPSEEADLSSEPVVLFDELPPEREAVSMDALSAGGVESAEPQSLAEATNSPNEIEANPNGVEFNPESLLAPTAAIDSAFPPVFADSNEAQSSPKKTPPKKDKKESKPRDSFIQVRGSKVNDLLAFTSNLGIVVDEVLASKYIRRAEENDPDLAEALERLRSVTREVRTASAGLALVPIGALFRRFGRAVREISRSTGKNIKLVTIGDDVEIDKSVVDALFDPLLHLVRNSADHGIEMPEERLRLGKTEEGCIYLQALNAGGEILVQVRDDGRGLNEEKIRKKAVEKGIIDVSTKPTSQEICNFILLPGFSTKEKLSELSGRGVGMDVVADTLKRVGGKLEIDSKPGAGTTFMLKLPLTLAFSDALIVEVGKVLFAIPLQYIGGVFSVEENEITMTSANQLQFFLGADGKYRLYHLLQDSRGTAAPEAIVLVRGGDRTLAIPVNDIRSTEQVTVRPLLGLMKDVRHAAACGVIGTGEVAFVLDCEGLARAA